MYGDTEVIRALARAMRTQGDDLRHEADHLRAQAESIAWSGVAADAMRCRVAARWDELVRCAELHHGAAVLLERHAEEVDRVKSVIAAIEHKVTALVAAARDRLAILVDPVDELLDRFVPPPSGHRDWLLVDLPGLS